jgi:hypothetical protein
MSAKMRCVGCGEFKRRDSRAGASTVTRAPCRAFVCGVCMQAHVMVKCKREECVRVRDDAVKAATSEAGQRELASRE